MNNFDTLLANININNIHPPPEIEEVLDFFKSKKPTDRATNRLWKNSTRLEKLEYVNLAQRVKSH
ncbi:hypothetical protein Glove_310g18 [Diversispora epigaea]|uniref:Uncharacterized protein n=1 Tax=Diversispora epigaea TaxID=1348612 RepID=A0A397HWH3_9GLOM|nr:hypothetical protein Glove_310g18 [Diversispora epigaea]